MKERRKRETTGQSKTFSCPFLSFLPSSGSSSVIVALFTTAITALLSMFDVFIFHNLLPVVLFCSFIQASLFSHLALWSETSAVDYQTVDSRRAAKASSTNMRQYPNDWLCGNKLPYQSEPGSVHYSAQKPYYPGKLRFTAVFLFICNSWFWMMYNKENE